jgi:arylsulfatase A-like enzyme
MVRQAAFRERDMLCRGRTGAMIRVLSLGLVLLGCASEPRPPNVVVIVSDDLDYSMLGYHGYRAAATPNLDAICEGGVYFTNGYVSSPSCGPSRAGLMTGRYQARYGYESQIGSIPRMIERDTGVDTREILLPELLKETGYATAVIGKWHLGYNEKYRPNNRGADHFFGFLTKGRYYWEEEKRSPVLRNGEEVRGEGYLTEALAREAADFIHRHADRPFFLYYAPWNVHVPHVVPEEYIPPGGSVLDGMVQALDQSVGTIFEALREEGLERDTLVVFVNDNGGVHEQYNTPFRGKKTTLYEGGIRVPFAMRWPGHLPEGSRYDHPVIQLDIFPTVAAAAGAVLPDDRVYDGVDLLPFVTGARADVPHERLFWRFEEMLGGFRGRAVRVGNLKLVVQQQDDGRERVELFDLARDPGESDDLAPGNPERVRALMLSLQAWEAGMPDPVAASARRTQPEPER